MTRKPGLDYPNQHCCHQHERQSPEHRSSCDPRDLEPQPPPRPPKRKSEQHHHYIERERDRDREYERKHDYHDHEDDHHRNKRHRFESSLAKPSTQMTASVKPASFAASAAAADRRPQRRILNRWQITITRSSR
ncbi:hypothetical protein ACFX11_002739 [Malus domestica]